jgi:hypothetical protein
MVLVTMSGLLPACIGPAFNTVYVGASPLSAQRTAPGRAQSTARPSGVYVKTSWATVSNPGFLDPLGGEDGPVVRQRRQAAIVGVGYEHFFERFGVFAGVTVSTAMDFETFGYSYDGATQDYAYENPTFRLGGVEFGGHWRWSERLPLTAYVVLDIAVVHETYTLVGTRSPYTSRDDKSQVTARPGIGLGGRTVFSRWLSAQLQYELIVAAASREYSPSQGPYLVYCTGSVCSGPGTGRAKYTRVLSAGLVLTMPRR